MAKSRVEKKSRIFRYIAKGKFHIPMADKDENDRPINKILGNGDRIVSTKDLKTLWPGKFVEVTDELARQDTPLVDMTTAKVASAHDVKTEAGKKDAPETKAPIEADTSMLGDDVTEDFEVPEGYQVFKNIKEYNVVKKGTATPLNKKPLKKSTVESYLSQLSPDEGE